LVLALKYGPITINVSTKTILIRETNIIGRRKRLR